MGSKEETMQLAFGPFTLIGSLLIPVAAMVFVAIVIWLVFRMAARHREVLSRERMAALEHGVPLPPEAFLESHRYRPRNSLKAGIIGGGLGAGVGAALAVYRPDSRLWAWGLAIVLVAVAHLIYWRIRGRREWEEARALEIELAKARAAWMAARAEGEDGESR